MLADIILDSNSCLYSQWFPGNHNSIADSLSRDFHINDSNLSSLLASHFPEQAPFGLTILPVPPEIISWLTCLLLRQPQKEQWSKQPTRSKFALGVASSNTLGLSGSNTTSTSTIFPNTRESKSLAHFAMQSEKADYVMEVVVKKSSPTQSDPPWTAYRRSLSWQPTQTQDWMTMESLHCFYNVNSEDTVPQTHPFDLR
jgi:hypothetical protein